jgi:predicted membrane-bound spermidine synthase
MRLLLLLLFSVSGFTGLIYESIWSHYLKLFLGHAAYAQTLVLAIFMGGMAIGAYWAARRSLRVKDLLLAYAVVEGVIGALALGFHEAFVFLVDFSFAEVIPHLPSPLAVTAYKVAAGALLILPQSILLGMTFPLMSGGLARVFPTQAGELVALLYFSNSIGAALGALLSGFVLIAWVGLPGTVALAGGLNLCLAAVVMVTVRGQAVVPLPPRPQTHEDAGRGGLARLFLVASLLTGLASFFYEIGWIRLLSLVLGATTHAFELMLAAFITGLALGGLWIKHRIQRGCNAVRWSGWIQVCMGALAAGTLVTYEQSFGWMAAILQHVSHDDAGYAQFNLGSQGIAFAMMLPPTICAGMTLPLFTHCLLARDHGEGAIGRIYAANTLGAIVGVVLAVHWVMPLLGLKSLLLLGGAVDILLGGCLLTRSGGRFASVEGLLGLLLGGTALALVAHGVTLNQNNMTAAVYRYGELPISGQEKIAYYQDGKTATVSLRLATNGTLSIQTNGKTDASLPLRPESPPSEDEYTGIHLAVAGLAHRPGAAEAAVIGLGSGLTTHTLLQSARIRSVDTVEIEPAMVEGARLFYPKNASAFADPRSHIHIEDAKSFFASYGKRYDLIVSEPSNPWVSGVASLFSVEFYRDIKRYLAPRGVLVQWIQLYEFNDALLASVVRALRAEFADYRIYLSNDLDAMVVARADGLLGAPDDGYTKEPGLAPLLARASLSGIQDLESRRIGDARLLDTSIHSLGERVNSNYHPYLDLMAPKARFLSQTADFLPGLAVAPLPILEMLDSSRKRFDHTEIAPKLASERVRATFLARAMRAVLLGEQPIDPLLPPEIQGQIERLAAHSAQCPEGAAALPPILQALAEGLIPYLTPADLAPVWRLPWWQQCETEAGQRLRARLALYRAVAERDPKAMERLGAELLATADPTDGPRERAYFLGAAVLGALAQGHQEIAAPLWERHAATLFAKGVPAYALLLSRHLHR